MDLHVIGPLASPAERAAVDAVLGPPESGWRGGGRDSADGGARRERRARSPEPPRPAAPGAARAAGSGRADHAAGPELRLPAPVRAARRGVRRRDVLRAALDEAAAARRRPRLRRHRLPARRCRKTCRRSRADARSGGRGRARRSDRLAAQPVPRPVRAGAGGDVHDRRRGPGPRELGAPIDAAGHRSAD